MIRIIKLLICIATGYISGSLNPAALLGKIKNISLRNRGTGNLGATNVMLIFGKAYGAAVMLFDMAKAFFSVKFAQFICPDIAFAGIFAGTSAVLGHIFPFYMKFKGGKGLASYAGMILAVDPWLFLLLLIVCVLLMVTANYSIAMPLSAGILFPILSINRTDNILYIILSFAVSILIMIMHLPNLKKALRGEETKIRDYIKGMFSKKEL